jgi:hypothetical protein
MLSFTCFAGCSTTKLPHSDAEALASFVSLPIRDEATNRNTKLSFFIERSAAPRKEYLLAIRRQGSRPYGVSLSISKGGELVYAGKPTFSRTGNDPLTAVLGETCFVADELTLIRLTFSRAFATDDPDDFRVEQGKVVSENLEISHFSYSFTK